MRQPAATTVLALVLLLTLLGAQVIVWARSGRLIAERNAGKLIKEVAEQGLSHYLGRKPIVRYFLIESNGETVGYDAVYIEPQLDKDGKIVFRGSELHYSRKHERRQEASFSITDDLSQYTYTKLSYNYRTNQRSITIQRFMDGQLVGVNATGQRQQMTPEEYLPTNNLAPPPLLDFFSSMSALQSGKRGAVFSLPIVSGDARSRRLINFIGFWVRPGGEVPGQFRLDYPYGRTVKVELPGAHGSQTIYYDEQHQVIWQLTVDPEGTIETMTAVARDKLVAEFPRAEGELDQWLRQENNEI